MTSKRNRGGGSVRDIRNQHLPAFGWQVKPRDTPEPTSQAKPRRRWKREGILHYPDDNTD